jgi:membrane associated rhomboid family serine protease
MEIHAPDPAYARSAEVRANFRRAVTVAAGFTALLWLIQYVSWGLELRLPRFGVRPREADGLLGVVLAPLLHADFAHLLANTPPVLVLGAAMLHLYPRASRTVFPLVWLVPGLAVWWLGQPGTVHVGASGLVYGLAAYVFVAGLLRRDRRAIASSLIVVFLYGTLVWGVLPIKPRMSWETHLAAAWVGVALALALRHLDLVPRRRYSWEDEVDGSREGAGDEARGDETGGDAIHGDAIHRDGATGDGATGDDVRGAGAGGSATPAGCTSSGLVDRDPA